MKLQRPGETSAARQIPPAKRLEDLPKLIGDFKTVRPMLDGLLAMHHVSFEEFIAPGRDNPDLLKLRCVFCFVAMSCGGVSHFQIGQTLNLERSVVSHRIKRCQIWMDAFPEFRAKVLAWVDFFGRQS